MKGVLLDFKTIEEDWNIYELEDGTRIKVRTSITQCNKALDPQTDQLMYREDGSPIYGLEFGVQAVFDYSEKVFKKQGRRGDDGKDT